MGSILIKRIIVSLPTLFGVSIVAFGLIRMVPGDPALLLLGERGASPEVYEELIARLGLDKPLYEQYFLFIKNAISGDLGESIISKSSVLGEFMSRFPATIELGLVAMLLATLVGVPIGILAAVYRKKFFDYFFMSTALVGYSMPIFWWGLILILFFSVGAELTPVSGRLGVMFDVEPVTGFLLVDVWWSETPWAAFKDALWHLILPSVALATIPLAAIARMTRSSMLEVMREDYMRTAKAKGLNRYSVIVGHGLRNALMPIITVIGLMVGTILTGAILTETIFSWPGIGKWLVSSVEARDYPVIQGGILLTAFTIIIVNLTVDMIYFWVNPLIREKK